MTIPEISKLQYEMIIGLAVRAALGKAPFIAIPEVEENDDFETRVRLTGKLEELKQLVNLGLLKDITNEEIAASVTKEFLENKHRKVRLYCPTLYTLAMFNTVSDDNPDLEKKNKEETNERKKANHQANIVKITEILPHNNADNLVIIPIGQYQVVARKGDFKIGSLGVYIQPDSVVPQTEPFRFIWEPHSSVIATVYTEDMSYKYGEIYSIVPEKYRRITVRKFRGEWSEGLLLPVRDFGFADNCNLAIVLLEDNVFYMESAINYVKMGVSEYYTRN